MSALTDLKSQAAQAACFNCLPSDTAQAIKTYLLAVIANGSLDPKTLLAQARGFFAIPSGFLPVVQATLSATLAGSSVPALVAQSGCAAVCQTPADSLAIQLLSLAKKAVTSTDPKTLARLAACFVCIPTGRQASVQAFLMAVAAGVVPAPPAVPGGGTGPAPTGPPPSVPPTILKTAIKNFAFPPKLIQMILGDAIAAWQAGNFPTPSTVSGFSFIPSSDGLSGVAAWDVPPSSIVSTELWTSSDGITYALASTTPAPGTTANVTAPAVGSFLFAKARWVNAATTGPFCSAQEVSGRVCDWAKRVIANGGSATSFTERTAANTFDLALVSAGLDSLMLASILVIPGSLIGALTPLYKLKGSDPWTNHNFLIGDLTINGMLGDGASKFADTGFHTNDFPAIGNGGATVYTSTFTASVNGVEIGGTNVATFGIILQTSDGGNAFALMWDNTNGLFSAANPNWKGYFSGNRIATNNASIYIASSVQAHTNLAQDNLNVTNFGAGDLVFAWAWSNVGVAAQWSNRRISYLALHQGLTQAQSLAHYNAVQAFRISIGGGFV